MPRASARPRRHEVAAGRCWEEVPCLGFRITAPSLGSAVGDAAEGKDTIERAEIRSLLAPDASSPARARQVVRDALSKWRLPQFERVACLLVTELVANVVLHTESASELTVRHDGECLYVGVRDHDPRLPARRHRLPTAATGRGLALVDELSTSWGASPAQDGKIVWFELRVGREDDVPPPGRDDLPARRPGSRRSSRTPRRTGTG